MQRHNLYTKLFRQLRGYFISPQLNVWKSLRKRLFNDDFPDNISKLKDYAKEPPTELFDKVLSTYQQMQLDAGFSKLKDFRQQPDEKALENILERIDNNKIKKTAVVRSIPLYKRMIAAAAIIGILISSFFLYSSVEKNNNAHTNIVTTSKNTDVPLIDTVFKIDSVYNDLPSNKLLVNKNWYRTKNKKYYFNASNHLSFYEASIGDKSLQIQDNDLLYSFANYTYEYDQKNPWNEKKGTVVKINEYTDLNISPYMSSVISDLYKVKKNGKATNKAKRAKAKINKWRKTDIKKFDKKKTNNPLDIIDLGENVY